MQAVKLTAGRDLLAAQCIPHKICGILHWILQKRIVLPRRWLLASSWRQQKAFSPL